MAKTFVIIAENDNVDAARSAASLLERLGASVAELAAESPEAQAVEALAKASLIRATSESGSSFVAVKPGLAKANGPGSGAYRLTDLPSESVGPGRRHSWAKDPSSGLCRCSKCGMTREEKPDHTFVFRKGRKIVAERPPFSGSTPPCEKSVS